MTGPATHIEYIANTGNHYPLLVPQWVATFTTDAAATSTNAIPRGFKRRRRYLMDIATGKEIHITVGDITKAAWTAAWGTPPTTQPVVPGHTGATYHFAGSSDEKFKKRG